MKKYISLLMFFIMMLSNMVSVSAAGFSVSTSSSTISPNKSFTVTISTQGAGQFSISASNGKVSNSSIWVDGNGSVSVTAGASGTTSVTVTALDATGYDESRITGSKSVSVSIKKTSNNTSNSSNSPNSPSSSLNNTKPSSNSTSTSQTVAEKKSGENKLSSLSISEGTLSPAFTASTTTYKVDLTSDVKTITIKAKAKDSKATVSGTGEKELHVGENNIKISVTAENGSVKRYTISVYVIEKPTQFIDYNGQQLGVLNDLSKIDTPKGFEKTTITIDNKEVTALKNDKLGLTLLYLQDEKQQTGFYIYDLENKRVVSQYQTISVYGKEYILVTAPQNIDETKELDEIKIKIDNVELAGWKFEEKELSHYTLVYLMNDAGESGLYIYEDSEGTLQKYTPVEQVNTEMCLPYPWMIATGVFFGGFLTFAIMYYRFRKKSISAIKEYYQSRGE